MKTRIENALVEALATAERNAPPKLSAAIRDAVFPGGARVRPRLCLAVSEACGGDAPRLADAAACALELLHCASLVHDDLPCFDDADLRRGRPSIHRAHGEPLAVLAGDAMIIMAFDVVAHAGAERPRRLAPLLTTISRAVGTPHGIVAGQAWESETDAPLARYHRAKTGSLFVGAAMAGAVAAGADPAPWRAMGERLGEAYQVADDLLDAHAAPEEAGKPTGQDAARVRPSAVAMLGTAGALARLRALVDEASSAVPDCPGADGLRALVVAMAERLVPAGLRQSAA